jgi:hypothetical protein
MALCILLLDPTSESELAMGDMYQSIPGFSHVAPLSQTDLSATRAQTNFVDIFDITRKD